MPHSMKITADTASKPLNPSPDSDLLQKPTSRKLKARNPTFVGAGVRLRREGPPPGRRSRPETPLLNWKFEDRGDKCVSEKKSVRKIRSGGEVPVASARKIAAGLWRLHSPEVPTDGGGWCSFPRKDRTGPHSQSAAGHAPVLPHQWSHSQAKDLIHSPRSVSGPRNDFLCKHGPSFNFSNSAMEGATKWDPGSWKTSDEVKQIYSQSKLLVNKTGVSALEIELKQAQIRINELEAEQQSSKKKLEHFLKKLSDERSMWRSREHEKIRAIIDDMKAELHREKKTRQRAELVNSKLVNELADSKLSAKRFMQDYEKERKARELIEEVCDELAKEIGEDKAEVEALKRELLKLREEVDDERKMLQMAEVWREERVQMKLVDAKVMLEDKYSQMNKLVADMKAFLSSKGGSNVNVEDMKKAEVLLQAAASMNIQDIRDFTYEPPAETDDFFAVFEDVNFCQNRAEGGVIYSPDSGDSKPSRVNNNNNNNNNNEDGGTQGYSGKYSHQNEDTEDDDDESGWETVSNQEDQGSSFSPDGSNPSVNEIRRVSNVTGSGTEWEENGEMRQVYVVVPNEELNKSSSIWRSCPRNSERYKIISVDGANRVISNGRLSTGGIISSPDRGSGKDLGGQWSSPESGNPHITRGMKGCIEWPRGVHKNTLKSKLLEARMESQKIQIRHVLKHKI